MVRSRLATVIGATARDRPYTRLLDIGSGAGFPGLPLKIARPAWGVTLLEATGKKTAFLQHMVEILCRGQRTHFCGGLLQSSGALRGG